MKYYNWEDIKDKIVKCPEHKVALERRQKGDPATCPVEWCGHYRGEKE